jgi:chemotaxis response regulator CheB
VAVEDVVRSVPDIVLLDIKMPVMDGLEALPLLLRARPGMRVLMVSALTKRNAEISFKALARLVHWIMCRSPIPIARSPSSQISAAR